MSLCKGEEGGKEEGGEGRREGRGGRGEGRREGREERKKGRREGREERREGRRGRRREGVSGMVQSASTNMPTPAHMTGTEENAQLHWYAIPQHTHSWALK